MSSFSITIFILVVIFIQASFAPMLFHRLVQPDLIILDEPTSALDLSVQAQILHLLKDVQKKKQMAYLFISHDPEVLRFMGNQIYVMEKGTIVQSSLVTS